MKHEYAEISRIPGIIGSIGGTHIRIQRPILHEKAYVNRKNYHSINMQAICDARHKYLSICATKPDRVTIHLFLRTVQSGKKFNRVFLAAAFC